MIFQTAFVLLETNSGQRFSKIEQYSVEDGPNAPPHPTPPKRSPFMDSEVIQKLWKI